jgi:hypothetical protein
MVLVGQTLWFIIAGGLLCRVENTRDPAASPSA